MRWTYIDTGSDNCKTLALDGKPKLEIMPSADNQYGGDSFDAEEEAICDLILRQLNEVGVLEQ